MGAIGRKLYINFFKQLIDEKVERGLQRKSLYG